MNDNDNNILIAQQGNCDVALVDGSKVLHYKDKDGNDQSLDIADLVNLTDGSDLFRKNTNLNVDWDISLPNLTRGNNMFSGCSGLISFTGDLPNLTDGNSMFAGCSSLKSWTVDLSKLENASSMFNSCFGLTSWTVNLPNLTDGSGMFAACGGLTSWTVPLPNLTNGRGMFVMTGLTSWTVDLPNLTNGLTMFSTTSLTSFSVDLPNLIDGDRMFVGCKLDKASVHRIAESIPTKPAGAEYNLYKLTLGIDASLKNDADVAADLATIETTKKWALTTEWN